MNRIVYNKLIRDRIPEIIEKNGKNYKTSVLSDSEFLDALFDKLLEESKEACEARTGEPGDIEKEISDIYEIIDTVINVLNLDKESILELQSERRNARGGFKNQLKLIWVEER